MRVLVLRATGPTSTLALKWSDDKHQITVYVDEKGLVVGKHIHTAWCATPYFCRLEAMCYSWWD